MGHNDERNQNEINTDKKVQEETVNLRPRDIALGRKTAPFCPSMERIYPSRRHSSHRHSPC